MIKMIHKKFFCLHSKLLAHDSTCKNVSQRQLLECAVKSSIAEETILKMPCMLRDNQYLYDL